MKNTTIETVCGLRYKELILFILTFVIASSLSATPLFEVGSEELSSEQLDALKQVQAVQSMTLLQANSVVVSLEGVENNKAQVIIQNEATGSSVVLSGFADECDVITLTPLMIAELKMSSLSDADQLKWSLLESFSNGSVQVVQSAYFSADTSNVKLPVFNYSLGDEVRTTDVADRQLVGVGRIVPDFTPLDPGDPLELARLAERAEELAVYSYSYILSDGSVRYHTESFFPELPVELTTGSSSLTFSVVAGAIVDDEVYNLSAPVLNALQYGLSQWSDELMGSVPVAVTIIFTENIGLAGSAILPPSHNDGTICYQSSLGNQLLGYDAAPDDEDIVLFFDINIPWYLGTDANTSYPNYDLITVLLHELCHGLGFGSDMAQDGTYSFGYPSQFDQFLYYGMSRIPSLSVSSRRNALTSNALYWDGANAKSANGGSRIKMYAPSTYAPGSSVSHWDTSVSFDNWMEYAYKAPLHSFNSRKLGLMKDIGWTLANEGLSAPMGVTASDGAYTDKVLVSWNAVSGASHYRVFRATSSTANKTALGSWQSSTQFDDTTAVAGTTYYYWVQAAKSSSGANSSAYSAYNTGWRKTSTTASPPTGVSATDGTYTDKVRITWTDVSGMYYRVYRASSSTGTRTALGSSWSGTAQFDDTTAVAGTTYYYWVKASASSSGSNASDYSSYNTGYRKVATASTPTNVSASDGTYADKVRITWNGTSGDYFQVYRATSSSGTKTTLNSTWQSLTSFDDTSVVPGTTYYYWVKAATSSSGSNASAYSSYDSGYRQASSQPDLIPHQPTDWDDKIVVSTTTGTTTSASTFLTTDTLYLDMAVSNDSSVDIADAFRGCRLYVDDEVIVNVNASSGLQGGYYSYYKDYSIGNLLAGTHEIKIVADPDNEVAESSETNNEYTRTITVEEPSVGLSSLTITGPSSVNEGGTASYSCTANYQNGTTADVTSTATWSDNSSYASIDKGVLTASSVPSDQTISITASFKAGVITINQSTSITIKKLEAPVTVDNLAFAQRPGTKLVDITFDLLSDFESAADIAVGVKNGTTDLSATSFTGDIGDDITVGTGKSIVWDMAADWDGQWSTNMEIAVTASTGGSSGPVTLFDETFDTTTFTTANWSYVSDAVVDTLGISEPSSPYSARLNGHPVGGDELRSVAINLSSAANVTLTYHYQRGGGGESTESGDDLILEYKNASGIWVELERQLGSGSRMTTYQQQTVSLPAAALHSAFQFRFINVGSSSASSYYDDWFVDDILIVGGGSGGIQPPADMVFIPDGSFQMGNSLGDSTRGDETPVHTVSVDAFYIAKFEVSQTLWEEVATWASQNGYDIGNSSVYAAGTNHPVVDVTWYESVKWCNARSQKEGLTPCYTVSGTVFKIGTSAPDCNFSANGYRLPTEAEWEKAARGGLSGKRFPWGDTITHSQANYESSSSYIYDVSSTRSYHPSYNDGSQPYTSPVGSFSANGYGLYDMVGNTLEWVNDWYSSDYYSSSPSANPRGASTGSMRVYRGGAWEHDAEFCRVSRRQVFVGPSYEENTLGFRPVRSSVPLNMMLIPSGGGGGTQQVFAGSIDEAETNPVVHSLVTGAEPVQFSSAEIEARSAKVTSSSMEQVIAQSSDTESQLLDRVKLLGELNATGGFTIELATVALPQQESFESGFGIWTSDTTNFDIPWTRDSGGTPSSSTGPTSASDGSYYLYTEATGAAENDTALLFARFDLSSASSPELKFDYHMYGSAMGSLMVMVHDGVDAYMEWTRAGQQHSSGSSAWTEAVVDLSDYAGNSSVLVSIAGIVGTSYTSDMAIDNIRVADQVPPIDLASHQPPEWDHKIIVRSTDDPPTEYDSGVSSPSFSADDELYISFGSANFGTADAGAYDNKIYIDGVLEETQSITSTNANGFTWRRDHNIGKLSAGTHTIRVVIDANNDIVETDEGNNEYSRTITVLPSSVPTTSTTSTSGSLDSRDYLLTVLSDHGAPSPDVGTHTYCWHSTVNCSVDAAVTEGGRVYDNSGWTGTGSVPASGSNHITPSILLTTPSSSITWLWEEEITYVLTVENGSGSGSYSVGEVVTVSADPAPSGQEFAAWTGDVSHLDNAMSETASVTMPEQDISLTASYQNIVVPDPFGNPSIYPTLPMNILASVTLFDLPAQDNDVLAVYCGEELRGKANVVLINGVAVANLSVYTATDGENLTFKVWDARNSEVYESSSIAQSEIGGMLGSYPDDLFPVNVDADPFGTVTVYPSTPMQIIGEVLLFDQPAAEGDVVAVYSGDELRGKATVTPVNGVAMVNLSVFTPLNGEQLSFSVWDESEDEVHVSRYSMATSEVGGTLGTYPDDLFLIEITDQIELILNLPQGWSQISLNLNLDDFAPDTVFTSVAAEVDRVVCVSGKSYNPQLPPMLNSLSQLQLGEGYWINMKSRQTLTLRGNPVDLTSRQISLSEGWNHIGYLPPVGDQIRTVMSNALASGYIERITGIDGIFNPHTPDEFNSMKTMHPGQGYWVKASANFDFTYQQPTQSIQAIQWSSTDPFGLVVQHPNPQMSVVAKVQMNSLSVDSGDVVAAFVGDELRAKNLVVNLEGESYTTLAIQVKQNGETLTFKLWDVSADQIREFPENSVLTESGGEPYPYNAPLLLNVSVASSGESYDTWILSEGIPTGQQDWDDCPANDGIENIWKYAAGLPAMSKCTQSDVFIYATDLDAQTFTLRYFVSKNASEAEITPIWKRSLSDTAWLVDGMSQTMIEENALQEIWEASIPLNDMGFIQLNVDLSEE